VLVGQPEDGRLLLASVEIRHTPTTDNVTACRRQLWIEDGSLVAEVAIAVNNEEPMLHTRSVLHRVR